MADREKFPVQLRALRDSGLLRPDVALGEIVKVTERLTGLSGAGKGAWEFIGPNFVWRGDKIADQRISREAFAVIQESSVVNLDFTLGAILEMSERIPGSANAAWEFIGPNFVWRGDKIADIRDVVVNPAKK